MRKLLFLAFLTCFITTSYATVPWPFEPFDSAQPLGNSYGEFQDYGGGAYVHPGIDILHPAGSAVYAVKAGWVKAVLTTAAELHWRVAIGDSAGADSCDGWLYAHLDQPTIAVTVGQHVDSGQFLGNIVAWPIAGFSHCHFVKIRSAGITWTSDWLFIGNPLDELVNIDDFRPPYFVNVDTIAGVPFRFCGDNTNIYFGVNGAINGNVDIIAHAHDRVGSVNWVLAPYAMGYEIYSDSVHLGPYTSFVLTGQLFWDQIQYVVYKGAGACTSRGDYDQREFYEIVTNHDDDSLAEPGDTAGHWATGQAPNDWYTVKVWARDRYGNIAWDSMKVRTNNYYSLAGTVTTSDGCPINSGAYVTVPFAGLSDSANANGSFVFPSAPAGRYTVTASRAGYLTSSEVYEVLSPANLSIVLDPAPYINGDIDHSGGVDISDVVYLINFIFGGGPAPVPWSAAVHIDPSPEVDISDAVYLLGFIFGGGTPPGGK